MKCNDPLSYEYQLRYTLEENERPYYVSEASEDFTCMLDSDSEWVSISKLPNQNSLSTCFDFGSNHIHAVLIAGSQLMPSRHKIFLKVKKGNSFKLPYKFIKELGLKNEEVCVREELCNFEVASEIQIERMVSGKQIDTINLFPEVIEAGMDIPVLVEKSDHCLYGGIFTETQTWKIVTVNKSYDQRPYIFDKNKTKISFAKSKNKIGGSNEYKNFCKNSKIFSNCCNFKEPIKFINSICKMNGNLPIGILIKSTRGCGKRVIVTKAAKKSGFNLKEVSMFDIANMPALVQAFQEAKFIAPCILHIRQFADALNLMTYGQKEILHKIRDIFANLFLETTEFPLIIIISSSNIQNIPGLLRNLFIKLEILPPNETDRIQIISTLSAHFNLELDIPYIAK